MLQKEKIGLNFQILPKTVIPNLGVLESFKYLRKSISLLRETFLEKLIKYFE